jgi:hypothetical protein
MAWANLQYIMGLVRLGHEVYYVEDSDDYTSCYDFARDTMTVDPTYGLGFANRTFRRIGLSYQWAYHDSHSSRWMGPCADVILSILKSADILLDPAGVNPMRPWFLDAPIRVLIDVDPVFNQIRYLSNPAAKELALRHNVFLSFAENIGTKRCIVPDDGLPWKGTHQPIVLEAWPVTPGHPDGKFTTVMKWDSYPAQEHNGRHYGVKSDSFGPYFDLPEKVGRILEITIGTPTAPLKLLRTKGWALRKPFGVARSPWTYQRYIQRSKAEFSVAKHGYVVSRSGWFSDRSGAYLASGRPVIVQDTGLSGLLPTGVGLLTFSTPDGAVEAIEDVNASYNRHCTGARELAEEYFDSDKVLSRLIEGVFSGNR